MGDPEFQSVTLVESVTQSRIVKGNVSGSPKTEKSDTLRVGALTSEMVTVPSVLKVDGIQARTPSVPSIKSPEASVETSPVPKIVRAWDGSNQW